MAATTNIEWCDATFNPWIGCTRVSPACDDCYAARSTPARALGVLWGPHEERRRTGAANWKLPLRWNAQHEAFAAEHGRRRRVFCASLADVFDNHVDPQWRIDLLELIAACPNLDWLLLTKRIGNAEPMLDEALDVMSHGLTRWRDAPWPNVWIGATVVNQQEADRDVPKLLAVPARVRFLSIEPMLGPVDLTDIPIGGGHGHHEFAPIITCNALRRANSADPSVHWVICGGESGPNARPMHPVWAKRLRYQCAKANVPFLFKQWGEWISADQEACPIGPPESRWMWGDGEPFKYGGNGGKLPLFCRAGKAVAGRMLDGVEHNGSPV